MRVAKGKGRGRKSGPVRVLGLGRDAPDSRDVHYDAKGEAGNSNIPHIDLTEGLTSSQFPVFEQGHLNSCTANAISAAVMLLRIRRKKRPLFVPSRMFIWWKERKMDGTTTENAECTMRDGLKALARKGICPESPAPGVPSAAVWPYDLDKYQDRPPAACWTYAKSHSAFRYMKVRQKLSDMRRCLNRGYPFTIGISVYPNFWEAATNGGHIPMPDERGDPSGHAMLVVGYEDAKRRFKIRNSFGEDWGDGGYGTLPYEFAESPTYAWAHWTIRHRGRKKR